MKKMIAAVAVMAIAGFVLTSCSKKGNYTCTCTINAGGTTTTQSLPFTNVKKNDAETSCKAAQTTYTTSVSTANCSLN